MNSKHRVTTDISGDIIEHLNLHNIQAQTKAQSLLCCLVNSYHEEKVVYPKVILLGPSGKEVCSHATHNSLGNLNFTHLEADFLNRGGDDITDILRSSSSFDTIYIANASNLSIHVQNILWKYLRTREVEVVNMFERSKEVFTVNDVCLILGTETLLGLSKSLYNLFTHCHLVPYTSSEILEILKQRCDYYKIGYTSEKVFATIAEVSSGRARKAVELLELSRRYMVTEGKDRISLLHVHRALTGFCFPSSNKV